MSGDDWGEWLGSYGLVPQPGDAVTIEVVAEHLTYGRWQVDFSAPPVREGQ
jgi:hypothetical protein